MIRQIRKLTGIQLCNLFGLNELRYTKDRQKKLRWYGMTAAWGLLIVMLIFYIALLSDSLIKIGLGDIVPVYLFTSTSLIILFFSFFKAGSVIFQMRTFETLISLPVSKAAIVVSRFLSMYVTNLLMSFLVMLPGTVLYGIWAGPHPVFYIYSLVGIFFLPLLPMTLATIIGAIITAVSSRMKHKSLINSALTIIFAVGIIILTTGTSSNPDSFSEEALKNLSAMLSGQIEMLYPPAIWFGKAAVGGSFLSILLFLGVSIALFLAMVLVVGRYFQTICSALNATSAKNNYRMQELKSNPPVIALYRRELKRYFASSIYVTNTIIGYILMAVAAIALFFMGPEKLETALDYPGLIQKALPLFLAATAAMMTPTACSISMEGKQWWIAKTIPVRSKDIFDSKILVALTVALPGYLVAVVFSLLAVKPSLPGALWIVLVPAAYTLFIAVVGISVNLAMPIFDWENEVRVVKQSASVSVTLLIGFLSFLPPIICLLTLQNISTDIVLLITMTIIVSVTALLYRMNNRKNILYIG